MKSLLQFSLTALAGMAMLSSATAGSPVKRCLVRDANGTPRAVYVRVSDNRILYPRVVQQVERIGGRIEYRPALSSAYRPPFDGYGGYHPGYGYGQGYYGAPGRRYFPVSNGYPDYYYPRGNYGVDAILYHGPRGAYGIPGYGLPGGAFPRPVVRPQSSVIQIPRFTGNAKAR